MLQKLANGVTISAPLKLLRKVSLKGSVQNLNSPPFSQAFVNLIIVSPVSILLKECPEQGEKFSSWFIYPSRQFTS